LGCEGAAICIERAIKITPLVVVCNETSKLPLTSPRKKRANKAAPRVL
jgi:hypothetical protein